MRAPRFFLAMPVRDLLDDQQRSETMEEMQKTQEYAAERERRRTQQAYEGEDRRKAGPQELAVNPDSADLPVSGEDGTARR
jgi:hypothetical protein